MIGSIMAEIFQRLRYKHCFTTNKRFAQVLIKIYHMLSHNNFSFKPLTRSIHSSGDSNNAHYSHTKYVQSICCTLRYVRVHPHAFEWSNTYK